MIDIKTTNSDITFDNITNEEAVAQNLSRYMETQLRSYWYDATLGIDIAQVFQLRGEDLIKDRLLVQLQTACNRFGFDGFYDMQINPATRTIKVDFAIAEI